MLSATLVAVLLAAVPLEIENNERHQIVVSVRASSAKRRPWTQVTVLPKERRIVRLASDDTFDVRIYDYRGDGQVDDYGADELDLLSLAPDAYDATFDRWATWDHRFSPPLQLKYVAPESLDVPFIVDRDGITLRWGPFGGIGHRPNKPIIRP